MELLDYVKSRFKELPASRWEGRSSEGKVTVTEHHAGIDLSRGPWVKFKFKPEGSSIEFELQGYKTWNSGDRIRFGPVGNSLECDDDSVRFTAATNVDSHKLVIICKLTFEQNGAPFAFRFQGVTN